jgi:hypothetical protein
MRCHVRARSCLRIVCHYGVWAVLAGSAHTPNLGPRVLALGVDGGEALFDDLRILLRVIRVGHLRWGHIVAQVGLEVCMEMRRQLLQWLAAQRIASPLGDTRLRCGCNTAVNTTPAHWARAGASANFKTGRVFNLLVHVLVYGCAVVLLRTRKGWLPTAMS